MGVLCIPLFALASKKRHFLWNRWFFSIQDIFVHFCGHWWEWEADKTSHKNVFSGGRVVARRAVLHSCQIKWNEWIDDHNQRGVIEAMRIWTLAVLSKLSCIILYWNVENIKMPEGDCNMCKQWREFLSHYSCEAVYWDTDIPVSWVAEVKELWWCTCEFLNFTFLATWSVFLSAVCGHAHFTAWCHMTCIKRGGDTVMEWKYWLRSLLCHLLLVSLSSSCSFSFYLYPSSCYIIFKDGSIPFFQTKYLVLTHTDTDTKMSNILSIKQLGTSWNI